MSVCYHEAGQLLTLETRSTTYQMKIDSLGFLRHLYFGRRLRPGDDMSRLYGNFDRGFSGNPYDAGEDRTISLDILPQEYTSFGVGDHRVNALAVRGADGSFSADVRYAGHEIREGKYSLPGLPSVYAGQGRAQTLIVTLRDPVTRLALRLYYGVLEEEDILTRAVEFINEGEGTVYLEKAASVCLDLTGGPWDLIHFHGRHCMERQVERLPVAHAIHTISSLRGMSSHQHNPFVILCAHDANEDAGDCCGLMLVYSGNHKFEIEQDQMDTVRVVAGIHDTQFSWELAPGASFFTPEAILAYSGAGLTHLSHLYHHALRHNVCRGKYQLAYRPVLLNSWEASYFNINEEKALSLACQAAELGVELFVLDDGWFQGRLDDRAGLGDWYASAEKLPHGLAALAEQVRALGLKFGLWIEPEMVNEDSDLYRAHPDWALRVPGRPPMRARCQLVLDLTRRDVREYLYDVLERLLSENPIDYIKWDMNRTLADAYSRLLPPERQGEVFHRYVLGVYELAERLTSRFPEVLFEGCAGGGGRFDAGMLQYFPQIWCSDDTDPICRLDIQYGTSFGYPVSAVGAHVSASPNHQTGRHTELSTRAVVAMSGAFGYELDPALLTDAEREEIRREIADYRRYAPLIHGGLYYRLTAPEEGRNCQAWQFVSPDRGEALLNLVLRAPRANAPVISLKLKGLDPEAVYVDGEGRRYSGASLLYGGYTFPPLPGDHPARQVHFVRAAD